MEDFGQLGFALQALFAFGGGIIAFLSPCVLPLVPGYLGLMSGYSIADLQSGFEDRLSPVGELALRGLRVSVDACALRLV